MSRVEVGFLAFDLRPRPAERKTDVWSVSSNWTGARLGEIRWYAPWRRYCFAALEGATVLLDAQCMDALSEFIRNQMAARKAGLGV